MRLPIFHWADGACDEPLLARALARKHCKLQLYKAAVREHLDLGTSLQRYDSTIFKHESQLPPAKGILLYNQQMRSQDCTAISIHLPVSPIGLRSYSMSNFAKAGLPPDTVFRMPVSGCMTFATSSSCIGRLRRTYLQGTSGFALYSWP